MSISENEWNATLPEQLPRSFFWKGEHDLILALIGDAVRAAMIVVNCSCVDRICCTHNRRRVEARKWILSDDPRLFGFRWCCENIGTDAGAVRRKLRREEKPQFTFHGGKRSRAMVNRPSEPLRLEMPLQDDQARTPLAHSSST